MEEEKKEDEKKSAPAQKNVLALLASLVGLAVLVLGGGYFIVDGQVQRLSENGAVRTASRLYQLPAAEINGSAILYADYIDDVITLRTFFANSQDFGAVNDGQLSDMTISRLLAAELVKQVAKELDVTVTPEDIQARRDEIIATFDNEEAAETEVQNMYGWNLDTYIQKVVVPIIREEKVQEAFQAAASISGLETFEEVRASHILFPVEDETEDGIVRQQAQEVIDRLNNGEDFAALAAEFGSDATKDKGGDLGWFGRGVMVPVFEETAFGMEPGEISQEPVKSEFGYHIIRLDEKRDSKDFLGYMDDRFRNSEVKILIPINNPFAQAAQPEGQNELTPAVIGEDGISGTDGVNVLE